jgi:hypothetical protein
MKKVHALACVLLLCLGCASEGGKSDWDEFWKDLRGDNMKMRNDWRTPDLPSRSKSDN